MDIYITLDYELYFGEETGTVNECLIKPTQLLVDIAAKYNAKFTFFVDAGFLIQLQKYALQYKGLEVDLTLVVKQLQQLVIQGHAVQLHIHPHWEDSYYDGSKWIINVNRYKLSDFSEQEVMDIVTRYKKVLQEITNTSITAYRAGGWCAQPFEPIAKALKANGITIDSTAFYKGYNQTKEYYYDFRNAPNKSKWTFENDICKEVTKGYFTELPIAADKVSPLFYWKLFLLGRLDPLNHKPIGKGKPIQYGGERTRYLTKGSWSCMSIDGYFATLLTKSLKKAEKKKQQELVFIGHPKAFTLFALNKVDSLIASNATKHLFKAIK